MQEVANYRPSMNVDQRLVRQLTDQDSSNKASIVRTDNLEQMIREGLHPPMLEKRKLPFNSQRKRKRIFFKQQTKTVKKYIRECVAAYVTVKADGTEGLDEDFISKAYQGEEYLATVQDIPLV
jgi:hypothetical protein